MFGTNPIVGRAFFKDAPAKSLMVTSIFYSIQGEGPQSGKPAVFVRLSKCNLNCSFCDALFEQGEYMTYDDLLARIHSVIRDYWEDQDKNPPLWVTLADKTDDLDYKFGVGLVVTGGEPAIQKNIEEFMSLADPMFKWTQTESNGIQPMDLPRRTIQVVSPKCIEKDGKAVRYLQPNRDTLDNADCLKFVMSSELDSPYNTVPDWAFAWKAEREGREIYVSPMNVYTAIPQKMKLAMGKTDKSLEERSTVDEVVSFWEPGVLDQKANQKNHEYAARYAMEHGCRFQVQAHLLASLA